jgi:Holliday junction resolvase
MLKEAGIAQRNNQGYVSGLKRPDIVFSARGEDYHVECKRCEKLSLYEAYEQAEHDANGKAIPVVMHRRSRKSWLVIMILADWVKLIKGGL